MKSKLLTLLVTSLLLAPCVCLADIPIALRADDQLSPRAAYSPFYDEFLVVFDENFQMDDNDGINAVRVLPDGTMPTGQFRLNDPTMYDLSNPDVAYNPTDQEFLVVWESQDNPNDKNIYAAIVPAGFDFVYDPFVITTSVQNDCNPRVAFSPEADEYLVVWERSSLTVPPTGDADIIGQRLDYTGNLVDGEIVMANTSSVHQHKPDVAANVTVNDADPPIPPDFPTFMVVWHTGNGDLVQGRCMRYDSSPYTLGPILDISNDTNNERNAVVAANPVNGEFLVAWESENPAMTENTTIRGRFISNTCQLMNGAFTVAGSGTYQNKKHLNPDICFDPFTNTYSIVYELHRRADDINVHLSRVSSTGSVFESEVQITSLVYNLEQKPAVVADDYGSSLFVWEDNRDIECCHWNIYGLIKDMRPTHDFGDAPNEDYTLLYPTLQSDNGAKHKVYPNIRLGALIDAECDGLPSPMANGDDIHNQDDEDGVKFPNRPLIPGKTATVEVTVAAGKLLGGLLYGWIDFNRDGSWAEEGDQIFNGVNLHNGTHTLTFDVPKTAQPNTETYARFRFTTQRTPISYYGEASDGEVEDYVVIIGKQCNIKWVQPPEEEYYGIDIRIDFNDHPCIEEECEDPNFYPLLADDFLCTKYDVITKVTLWGSWKDDNVGHIEKMYLYIFSDVPADANDPNSFSKPGKLLWTREVNYSSITTSLHKQLQYGEFWWDALEYVNDNNFTALPANDTKIYKIEIEIPEEEAFLQRGTCEKPVIYWLGVQAMVTDGTQLGWKTRRWPTQYNDDAVLRHVCLDDLPCSGSFCYEELKYPKCHDILKEFPSKSQSIDLAFMLESPDCCAGRIPGCADLTGDNFVNFDDVIILFDQWLTYCE